MSIATFTDPITSLTCGSRLPPAISDAPRMTRRSGRRRAHQGEPSAVTTRNEPDQQVGAEEDWPDRL
jgi:hypothetical protein